MVSFFFIFYFWLSEILQCRISTRCEIAVPKNFQFKRILITLYDGKEVNVLHRIIVRINSYHDLFTDLQTCAFDFLYWL